MDQNELNKILDDIELSLAVTFEKKKKKGDFGGGFKYKKYSPGTKSRLKGENTKYNSSDARRGVIPRKTGRLGDIDMQFREEENKIIFDASSSPYIKYINELPNYVTYKFFDQLCKEMISDVEKSLKHNPRYRVKRIKGSD